MKLGDKNNALAAMVVVAFATHPGTARAEDVAAEIHLLKEQVKQLEPLKERLKQLEAEVAKEKRERKEARGGVRNAAAQPGPGTGFVCKGAACPPPPPAIVCKDGPCPPPPLPVFVSFTNELKVEVRRRGFQLQDRRPHIRGWRGFQPTRAGIFGQQSAARSGRVGILQPNGHPSGPLASRRHGIQNLGLQASV